MSQYANGDAPTGTSTSLLERIRYQDIDAWRRFVPLYAPVIYDLCRRSGIQPSDADDVTQEVLHAVSVSIKSFRKQRPEDSFRGWLYRIAQNKVRDHHRRSERLPPAVGGSDFNLQLHEVPASPTPERMVDQSVDPPVDPTADRLLLDVADGLALSRALELIRNDFQPHIWQAFWRMTVGGERAAEVAADLGLTPNGVRQAKFRVIQRLRAEFGDLIDL
ncbi:MAG: sigma-70 family RNA polymerase sigma factor [Pirellulales bacterium]